LRVKLTSQRPAAALVIACHQLFGWADEADEEVGFGFVGNDVGGDAALDDADVHGAVADAFDDGEREGLDVVEGGEEFVDGGVA
jgi:hypothetical protein